MAQFDVKVKGIVKNQDRYLVVKQWYDDRILDPYRWRFIDGNIEFGEDPAKAVVRSIKEQTGIDAVMDRVLYTWSYLVGDTFCVGICYECLALHTETVLSEDLQELEWIKKEEIEEYIDNKDLLHDLENSNFTRKDGLI